MTAAPGKGPPVLTPVTSADSRAVRIGVHQSIEEDR
jgi:hypothetical protein